VRQATVYIDQEALQYNLNRVRELAPAAKIVSMVKANAYGHGVKDCLAALKDTDAFAMALNALSITSRSWTGCAHIKTLISLRA